MTYCLPTLDRKGVLQILVRLTLIAVLGVFGPVYAQSPQTAVDEVQALVESGELDKALVAADRFIADHPADPRMRFLKGLIFTNQSKWQDAIEVFRALADDFPSLPAPLNNLAVVHAETGNYETARDVLIEALKIDPDYAAAHENLGDIYVTLAARAYQEALSKDSAKQTAGAKLRVLKQLVPDPAEGGTQATAAAKPAMESETAAPRTLANEDVSTSASNDAETHRMQAEVGDFVQEWAAAWSAQDVERYLGFYDDKFLPADGKTIQQWRAERRSRLSAPSYIRVSVQNIQPQIYADSGRAIAQFVQSYESDTYRSIALKELLLQRDGSEWRIVRETVRRER